ncbi:hypothetical protein QWY93_02450 [Echinicola jeungdonensis]|uniref:Uncharacterized protein n=1 Tax=Echinicola jeungdonensis TaxID=709343 RepID=A0ABV5J4J4_9BACT|nr:hypothetical protein [Echinicola jeungdonensis]MDN3668189.1 hypothetical protein [Echinicola jeungdonensis]
MSDEEFDLMDELYFVQSFKGLKETLCWEEAKVLSTLQLLFEKKYIKCLAGPDEDLTGSPDIPKNGKQYYFLATKKGLMAHNTL